jgi:hypothetical protein
MAGTVTQTGSLYKKGNDGKFSKVVFNWTSDASGNADVVTDHKFSGQLVTAQHAPRSGGSAPTDLYEVTVLNSDGIDILVGTGANIPVTTGKTSQAVSSGLPLPTIVESTLSLNVSNAGNAKTGTTILIFKDANAQLATQG